jgi:hypothetical protein
MALLSGCGPKTQLDLDLRSVSITVPRLVTPAVELVPPSTAPQPAQLPALPPVTTILPATTSYPTFAPVAQQPAPACPKADVLDVPAKPATINVDEPPAAATYTQTASGSFAAKSSGSLAGPVTVQVKRLPRVTSSAGQVVDAYQVIRTDAARKSSSVEQYQLVHPSSAPTATAGGIYLVGMAWHDPVRGDLTFQPSNGLQILPVPVAVAQSGTVQYVGSATDPDTLTTLSLTRNVNGRKRVDVCGKLVDTFTVDMSGTLTTSDVQRQVSWTQQLATAYGGVDVEDTLGLTNPVEGFSWVRTVRNTTVPKDTK